MSPHESAVDRYECPDEYDLAREAADNREAQEDDELDEYEIMQADDREYTNHS